MKREEMLLRAIGSVDDALIADAMATKKKPRPAWVRWGTIAACLCLILTVTAGAAKWGVEWWHGTYEPYGQHTVDWKYPLTPVTVREEAIDDIYPWVLQAWGRDGRDETGMRATWPDSYYIGAYLPGSEKLRTVDDLEEYLGIELTTSPRIDEDLLSLREQLEAVEDNYTDTVIDLIGMTELIRDAEAEYAETNKVPIGGIEADLDLGYLGTNCKAKVMIFIPLTQNFADDFPAEDWWFATVAGPTWTDYENGQFEVEELEISGKEVVIFTEPVDDLEDTATAMAIYSDGGIGYYICCVAEDWEGYENHKNVYANGRDRLLELLENLE